MKIINGEEKTANANAISDIDDTLLKEYFLPSGIHYLGKDIKLTQTFIQLDKKLC